MDQERAADIFRRIALGEDGAGEDYYRQIHNMEPPASAPRRVPISELVAQQRQLDERTRERRPQQRRFGVPEPGETVTVTGLTSGFTMVMSVDELSAILNAEYAKAVEAALLAHPPRFFEFDVGSLDDVVFIQSPPTAAQVAEEQAALAKRERQLAVSRGEKWGPPRSPNARRRYR